MRCAKLNARGVRPILLPVVDIRSNLATLHELPPGPGQLPEATLSEVFSVSPLLSDMRLEIYSIFLMQNGCGT